MLNIPSTSIASIYDLCGLVRTNLTLSCTYIRDTRHYEVAKYQYMFYEIYEDTAASSVDHL